MNVTKFLYNRILPKLFELQGGSMWIPIVKDLIKAKKRAIEYLNLQPGNKVLVTSIGAGFELDFILPKIGATGSVVGVDFSEGMLRVAQNKISKNGWTNVTLLQKDLREYKPTKELDYKVDAVLSNFGYLDESVLCNLISVLKPGGKIAISGPQPLTGIRKLLYPITFVPEMVFGLTWKSLHKMPKHIEIIKKECTEVIINENTFGRYFITVAGSKTP